MSMESVHWLTGILYLVASIAELSFYLGESPTFWRFLARIRFSVEVAPWPGLTLERMQGFRRDTPQALMVFEASSMTLMARRRHDVGARRMPAVVILEFEAEERGPGLSVKARWGFVPFLGLMFFVLMGVAVLLMSSVDGPPPMAFVLMLSTMMLLMTVVVYVMARSSAHTVLSEVECELQGLVKD